MPLAALIAFKVITNISVSSLEIVNGFYKADLDYLQNRNSNRRNW
jgi:hypothetical protein